MAISSISQDRKLQRAVITLVMLILVTCRLLDLLIHASIQGIPLALAFCSKLSVGELRSKRYYQSPIHKEKEN